jgi:predicted amidohydrolase YtcJ
MKLIYIAIAFLFFLQACKPNNADYIITNARIYTLNEQFDTASVLVIKDGKFLAVGGNELLEKYNAVNCINANNNFIYPGFIDAHCHYTGYAMDKYKLEFWGTKSFNEVVTKTIEYARTNKREWIEGRGWDQNDWEVKDYPTKDTLDLFFPNTPIFLMRIDGHAILCNQKALDLAGITTTTKVDGGEIILSNGKLTGILTDNAINLVKSHIPKRTQAEVTEDFKSAQEDCFKLGLTSVVDCGIKNQVVKWLIDASEKQKLQIRVSIMLEDEKANYDDYLQTGPYKSERIKIIGFKIYADGALGSRGAYLLEEYHDRHEHKGQLLKSMDSLTYIAQLLFNTKYQLSVHAIGDGANREVLTIFANILKGKNDRRWRIEHAQVLAPEDFHLFGDFSIVPSVQPTHATSDMYWAKDRLGEQRLKTAYAYNDLLKQNQWLPLGTDFPVEDLNPLYTYCAAVFRQDKKIFPAQGFQPENALSRKDALRGITIWAAKSTFDEKQKGSIEVGKVADFVMLPTDLMTASADSIYKTKVIATYLQGDRVYPRR